MPRASEQLSEHVRQFVAAVGEGREPPRFVRTADRDRANAIIAAATTVDEREATAAHVRTQLRQIAANLRASRPLVVDLTHVTAVSVEQADAAAVPGPRVERAPKPPPMTGVPDRDRRTLASDPRWKVWNAAPQPTRMGPHWVDQGTS
jgi:hypothetical protein